MGNLSRTCRALALLAVLVMMVPATYADDPEIPSTSPQGRIAIPGGSPSESTTPSDSPEARIVIPTGVTSQSAPQPTWLDLLIGWLRAYARIGPPIG